MLKIRIEDLYYGFIRNYASFGLRRHSKDTKWTHEILGFFARLGKMLGYYIEYEWERFDLVWFWSLADREPKRKPKLHVEHENNVLRLDELISKLDQSPSKSVVLIGYPETMIDWKRFISKVDYRVQKRRIEVLAILDGYSMDEIQGEDPIVGHVLRKGKKVDEIHAKRRLMEDDSFFTELVYDE